ncbi:MAG: hypothetical protein U0791_20240 [Gemmataceae bacterium]
MDWLSLGVQPMPAVKPVNAADAYQDFAVLAFLDAITGAQRRRTTACGCSAASSAPKMKNAVAEPFAGDKARGELQRASSASGSMICPAVWPDSGGLSPRPDTFKVGPTFTLKLVKGGSPGEWLVDEFAKQ